ncbi:MAG: hypothetical protein JWN24_4428 [Phycisphaerales bacterium]|nr:hypothetical protein [Phycisphaerales bacterium]
MKHRLFTLLSALSLLLAVATCTLWVRSWQWVAAEDSGSIVICYCGGTDGARFLRKSDGTAERAETVFRCLHYAPPPWHPAFATGVRIGPPQTSNAYVFRYWWVSMPDWMLTVAFAALPAVWMARRFRVGRRTVAGRCPICGYDLRASPGRCPECGTENKIPAASASRA